MRDVYQYLRLEKDYDREFIEFLIDAAKATIENYCNQIIFPKTVTVSVPIYGGRGVVPLSYVISVQDVRLQGDAINYGVIRDGSITWLIVSGHDIVVEATVRAGIEPTPSDVRLVLVELVQMNYNNSRNQTLGVDSRTNNVGSGSTVTRYLDLTSKHKQILARYTRWTI